MTLFLFLLGMTFGSMVPDYIYIYKRSIATAVTRDETNTNAQKGLLKGIFKYTTLPGNPARSPVEGRTSSPNTEVFLQQWPRHDNQEYRTLGF